MRTELTPQHDTRKSSMKPKLKIIGQSGNAFMLLGIARKVARQNNMDWESIRAEATSGDYDHVISTLMKYFEVC